MTLALYGKSRKRQGSLLFAALLAVLGAMVAGVAVIGTALAHHSSVSGSAACQTDGGYTITWSFHNSENDKLLNISNLTLSAGSWVGGAPTQIPMRTQAGDPGPAELTKTSTAPAGTASVSVDFDSTWTNGVTDNDNSYTVDLSTVCPAKIIIKKVVEGTGSSASDSFTAAVYNDGGGGANTSGEASGLTFSQNLPRTHTWNEDGSDGPFRVVETNLPSGYTATATKVLQGDKSCDSAEAAWDTTTPTTATGSPLDLLSNGEVVTVCFKNTKTPAAPKLKVVKDVRKLDGSNDTDEQDFTFNISPTTGVSPSNFKLDDNGSENYNLGNGWWLSNQVVTLPAAGGTFTITETQVAGWDVMSIECSGTDSEQVDLATGAVVVTANPGDDIVCTFKNKPEPPTRKLTVCKEVDGNGNGVNEGGQFTITVSGLADFTPTVMEGDSGSNNPECTQYTGIADGTVITLAETGVPNGWVHYPSYPQIEVSPGTDPADGATSVQVTMDQDRTVNFKNKKSLPVPTIEKVAKTATVSDPANVAFLINVSNPAGGGKVVVRIQDSGSTFVGYTGTGTCDTSGSDGFHDGSLTDDDNDCELDGGESVSIEVKPSTTPTQAKCDPTTINNTASWKWKYDGGSFNSYANTNQASVTLEGIVDSSCFTISKAAATPNQDADQTFWDISIKNDSGASQEVFIVDAGADFVSVSGGTCPGVSAGDDMSSGIVCSVADGATLVVKVAKDKNLQVCEGSNTNSATIYLGRHDDGTPVLGTPSGGSIGYTNEAACNVTVNLCKVWRISQGETLIAQGPRTFNFDVDGTAMEIPSVVEDGPQACINFTVGLDDFPLTITEVNITGFKEPYHKVGSGAEHLGDSVTIDWNGDSCEHLHTLVSFNNLVSSVFAVIGQPKAGIDAQAVCTVTFYNDDETDVSPNGNLRIEKYRDINGDGDANDPGEGLLNDWPINIVGNDIGGAHLTGEGANADGVLAFDGLTSGDLYDITEGLPAGWKVTRATVNGINQGAVTSVNDIAVPNGGTTVIRFYNTQLGGITVNKATWNTVNGISTQNLNDDDGWKITVSSAACGINQTKETDTNGNAVFGDLPLCSDYIVSENTVNQPAPGGYSVVGQATVSPVTPTAGGYTQVNFINETKTSNTPVCIVNCRTVDPTPTTVPPTPTVVPPTATPTQPGGTQPTPATAIAGERTPGASPTPIAPSTGGGLMGGTAGGFNLVLIVAGLLALTSGLSFVALGRKNR